MNTYRILHLSTNNVYQYNFAKDCVGIICKLLEAQEDFLIIKFDGKEYKFINAVSSYDAEIEAALTENIF